MDIKLVEFLEVTAITIGLIALVMTLVDDNKFKK